MTTNSAEMLSPIRYRAVNALMPSDPGCLVAARTLAVSVLVCRPFWMAGGGTGLPWLSSYSLVLRSRAGCKSDSDHAALGNVAATFEMPGEAFRPSVAVRLLLRCVIA